MKRKINDNLYYIGVNDRQKILFEGLWPLPFGVSYNSYLLVDNKTVLFDTVDIHFSEQFINNLNEALEGKTLDYLVINHMEPDHSGSIKILKKHFPEVQIIGNARTIDMVKGFYNIEENTLCVKDKEELSIGNYTLQFHLTPMVHWPETMMTYIPEMQTLFSGDAFGTFGTLDGGFTDRQLNTDKYWDEMIRYYSNIVGKYGSPVQKALEKLANVPISTICSTHGPVWTNPETIVKVVETYDRLSRYQAEDGVVIAYGSMYGHTASIAEQIGMELANNGVKNIIIHDVSFTDSSYIIRDIFKYKGLIIGSPTYNNQLFPKVESLLSQIQARDIKGRYFSYFGSFTWAGAAVKRLTSFAESSGFETIGEPIEMKQAQFSSVQQEINTLAKLMADKMI
ncbi:FprA family A-type flavoprotein [Bacteroidales bacterium OttesenSCG-928-I14]|nr:FprA family A-type flavoprotein [Bacteroidales bacterium OttesenSCG-928-I14]